MSQVLINFSKNFFEAHSSVADGVSGNTVSFFNLPGCEFLCQIIADDDSLKNYEPVVIEIEDLVQKLDELPPLDEMTFKAKLNDIISAYTKGKDSATLRIVVKRRESEE